MKLLSLLLVTALGFSPGSLFGFELIGHRGASYDAPENTLASFNLAWEQNADAAELDIYLTKDGQIAVIHDPNTKRTGGRDAAVASLTLEELQTLDVGSWKGERWKGEKIPALTQVLATIPAGKRLFIEIKCGPEVLPELVRVLAASGKKPEQLVIIGFNYETVTKAKGLIASSHVYWLVGSKKESQGLVPAVEELVTKAKLAGVDGLFLQQTFAIDAAFAAKVTGAGLRLYAWSINDPVVARRFAEAGVEGIGTDRPGWMRTQLAP